MSLWTFQISNLRMMTSCYLLRLANIQQWTRTHLREVSKTRRRRHAGHRSFFPQIYTSFSAQRSSQWPAKYLSKLLKLPMWHRMTAILYYPTFR